ncbi:hypothetical protein GCM10027614_36290 [Micromonospora vulcania]
MNLTDFQQMLDERSEDPAEHVMHHLRLHGVRAKVVARRRRRIATWTTCALVVLAGVATAAVLPGLRGDVTPPVDGPPQVRTIEDFRSTPTAHASWPRSPPRCRTVASR